MALARSEPNLEKKRDILKYISSLGFKLGTLDQTLSDRLAPKFKGLEDIDQMIEIVDVQVR